MQDVQQSTSIIASPLKKRIEKKRIEKQTQLSKLVNSLPNYLDLKADSGHRAQLSSSSTFENNLEYIEPKQLGYCPLIIHECEIVS